MSQRITLARPYAEAVFRLAQEQGRLKQWSETLAALAVIAGDRDMIALAHNPKFSRERLLALFLEVAKDVLDEQGTNFIKLILDNQRLELLPEIAMLFEQQKADAENSVDVEVISAFALDNSQLESLAQTLQKKLGRQINLSTRVDADLIGGMIVRAGDLVIDGSVTGHLNDLSTQLIH